MIMINIENLNKYYKSGDEDIHVLKDVSLRVSEGDFLAVLGASGSGKSTLMNIIGCMDSFGNGSYLLEGKAVSDSSEKELCRIRNEYIGFIFQKYHLIPQYNVLQNVMMPLLIRGYTRKEAEKEALESIERLGLLERVSHKPMELSGGQQQRVAISRALVTRPKILLADEPTGALDSVTGSEILKLFRELNDEGNTIIMITHDVNVAACSKRTIHITDGIIS